MYDDDLKSDLFDVGVSAGLYTNAPGDDPLLGADEEDESGGVDPDELEGDDSDI